jgi:hypothetical protein
VPFISIVDVFDALGIEARTRPWLRSRLQSNVPYGEALAKLDRIGWMAPKGPPVTWWDISVAAQKNS